MLVKNNQRILNSYISGSLLLCLFLLSCAASKPKNPFDTYTPPAVPNYSFEEHWAALPNKLDGADSVPAGLNDIQLQSQADVFFLYPTSYLNKRGNDQWNAAIDNEIVNQKTDESSIVYQASIFNGVGKVYAPRYRQAHYKTFFTKDTASARKAMDLAYLDVKSAFNYYLRFYNKKRPIILAGHSQGAAHLIRLLNDYFDNDSLKRKLVVAYVVGWPVPMEQFNLLEACKNKFETNCICSWRSFRMSYEGKFMEKEQDMIVTNPLDWSTEKDIYVDKSQNLGAVLDDISEAPKPGMSGAQIHKNILWVDKPKFNGSFFYIFPNYHVGDFNIFYMNVRQNAIQRLASFWK